MYWSILVGIEGRLKYIERYWCKSNTSYSSPQTVQMICTCKGARLTKRMYTWKRCSSYMYDGLVKPIILMLFIWCMESAKIVQHWPYLDMTQITLLYVENIFTFSLFTFLILWQISLKCMEKGKIKDSYIPCVYLIPS